MTADFTGERIIPGQVDINLFNEHFARYAFAARYAPGRRVLDAGCGTGYGSAELARTAASVAAIDIAPEAVSYARERFPAVRWTQGSCTKLPFASAAFDLVVSFEVIEHLVEWPDLLAEVRRVLAPGGQFLVSTPNKSFYAKTRELEGPNPYHEHEFEYPEFRAALAAVFPHVSIFLEDHTEGVLFRAVPPSDNADLRVETSNLAPESASFYVAVCSAEPQPAGNTFAYIPRAANLLAEKIEHVERLQGEVETKNKWLAEAQAEHAALLDAHSALQQELKQSNEWAQKLNGLLEQAAAERQSALAEMARGYEAELDTLNAELRQRTDWATETEQRLTAELELRTADLQQQTAELGRCVEILHQTEASLEERTRWAVQLNEEKERLQSLVEAAQLSRWLKIGRAIGLGPELTKR